VGQAIGPSKVDEYAEAADAANAAFPDLTLVEFFEETVFLDGAPVLDGSSLGEDDAVSGAVYLDDFHEEGLANQSIGRRPFLFLAAFFLFRRRLSADGLGEGDEGMDSFYVHEQAAFVVAADLDLEAIPFVESLLEDAPALFAAGSIEGEEDLSFLSLGLEDVDEDAVTRRGPFFGVGPQGLHLVAGNDAFGLSADVDYYAITFGADDDPFHDIAAVEGPIRDRLRFH
jgi:hypothetical protein